MCVCVCVCVCVSVCLSVSLVIYIYAANHKPTKLTVSILLNQSLIAFNKYENIVTGEDVMKQFANPDNQPHGGAHTSTLIHSRLLT